MYSPDVVCFCDIPPDDLEVHVGKYGRFGVAFAKHTLIIRGACPVFYIPRSALIRDMWFPRDRPRPSSEFLPSFGFSPEAPEVKPLLAQVFDDAVLAWNEYVHSKGPAKDNARN